MIKKLFNWLDDNREEFFILGRDGDNKNLGVLDVFITFIIMIITGIVATILVPIFIVGFSFKFIYQLCESIKFPRNIIKELENYEKRLVTSEVKYHLANSYHFSDIYEHDKNIDLKQFIRIFLFRLNNIYATYRGKAFVCGTSRRRSAGDIFLICKTYYPNCTFIEVLKILISMLEDPFCDITGDRCGTIKKYVFYVYEGRNYRDDQNVEYSNNLNFKEIIKVLK